MLYDFIEEKFESTLTVDNNNDRIQDLIDSSDYWIFKSIIIELDEQMKSPEKFESHVEDLLLASVKDKIKNKRLIIYVDSKEQKSRILKKIKINQDLEINNFKIIISDEIWYHEEWNEDVVLILDPNPSDDKVIKIVRTSILNKKGKEIPIISCNNSVELTTMDWAIRNNSDQVDDLEKLKIEWDKKIKKVTRKKKSNPILIERKDITDILVKNWAINWDWINDDLQSMTELWLVELVNVELSRYNPPIIDEAVLKGIWIPKLTKNIPALNELFERRKIRKTKTSIHEFTRIFFLQRDKKYYYQKLKEELESDNINNYLDFISLPLRKRSSKQSEEKENNKWIPWDLQSLFKKTYFNYYIHTELKKDKISDIWESEKHKIANYLFWDSNLSKAKTVALQELEVKWINSGLHLLSMAYSFQSTLKPFKNLAWDDEDSFLHFLNQSEWLKTLAVASWISTLDWWKIHKLSKNNFISLIELIFPEEINNLLENAIFKSKIEISTYLEKNEWHINSTTFKKHFWPQWENNLIWVRLFISILSEKKYWINEWNFSTNRDRFSSQMFENLMHILNEHVENKNNNSIDSVRFKVNTNVENTLNSPKANLNQANEGIAFESLCKSYWLLHDSINWNKIIQLFEEYQITATDLQNSISRLDKTEDYINNLLFQTWSAGRYTTVRSRLERWDISKWFIGILLEERDKRLKNK